jgi:pimeloyl-ACP methyl ester carboxylesterase
MRAATGVATDLTRAEIETQAATFTVYRAEAEGDPLLYLHSEVAVRPDPVALALAANRDEVCPVHPRFHEASCPDWVETVRDLADLYVDLVDDIFGGRSFDVVGASLGGWIAAELALLLPHRVRRLALLGPAGMFVPETPPGDHWFATDEERSSLLFEERQAAPEVDMEEYVANDEAAAAYAWNPRFCDPTLNHRARRLQMPTLLIWGSEDRLLPVSHADAWVEALPGVEVRVVSRSGHFPAYEQPEATIELVEAFLDRISGGADVTRGSR